MSVVSRGLYSDDWMFRASATMTKSRLHSAHGRVRLAHGVVSQWQIPLGPQRRSCSIAAVLIYVFVCARSPGDYVAVPLRRFLHAFRCCTHLWPGAVVGVVSQVIDYSYIEAYRAAVAVVRFDREGIRR